MGDNKLRYFSVEQGATLQNWFRIGPGGSASAYDLAANGYTYGRLQVRTASVNDSGTLLLDLTTDNGGIVFNYVANDGTGKAWSGYVYCDANSTENLIGWEDATYDFRLVHGGSTVQVISRGPAMLIPMVTTV